jgi:hypothetical protein
MLKQLAILSIFFILLTEPVLAVAGEGTRSEEITSGREDLDIPKMPPAPRSQSEAEEPPSQPEPFRVPQSPTYNPDLLGPEERRQSDEAVRRMLEPLFAEKTVTIPLAIDAVAQITARKHDMMIKLKRPLQGIEVLKWPVDSLDDAVKLIRLIQERRIEALIVQSHRSQKRLQAGSQKDTYVLEPCKECWIREWVFRLDNKK